MTHSSAFRDHAFEHVSEEDEKRIRSCHAELRHSRSCFHSDIRWEVYTCPDCQVKVWTVGGYGHWWNYEKPIAAGASA